MGCNSSSTETLINEKPNLSSSIVPRSIVNSTEKNKEHNLYGMNNYEQKENYSIKYKAIQKIGSGGYGKVYKVVHLLTNQIRAMKLLKRENILYQDDEQLFLKEIEILTKLDHPHIIKIFEYFQDEEYFYIITELCEGGELFEQIVINQHFTENDASIIMKQLFSSVFYMHSKGVVHRDLKPENILMESQPNEDIIIKIIDFGTSNNFSKSTNFTYKVGTPYYIAPEVIKKSYSNKCDLWSCGVILYILLSGNAPFDGRNDEEIMKNALKGKYNMDGEIWKTISDEAKNLISSLLEYDPEKRISAEEAVSHKWIQKYNETSSENGDKLRNKIELSNLRNFAARHKFQQATLAFLVHQVTSTDMMKDLRKIFKEFDKNGDGQLTYSELKEGFKIYFKNQDLADKEFDILVKNFDQDNNNFIEYEEFLRVTINPEKLINDKNLQMAFDFFDKDKSGKLSYDEIRIVLGIRSNLEKDNNLIRDIIKEVDLNNDGMISFDEFKQLMLNVLNKKQNY